MTFQKRGMWGPIVRKYWVKQGRKKHSRASLSPTELHNQCAGLSLALPLRLLCLQLTPPPFSNSFLSLTPSGRNLMALLLQQGPSFIFTIPHHGFHPVRGFRQRLPLLPQLTQLRRLSAAIGGESMILSYSWIVCLQSQHQVNATAKLGCHWVTSLFIPLISRSRIPYPLSQLETQLPSGGGVLP